MQLISEKIEALKIEPADNEKFTVHRLRVEDYEKMIEYGIFDEDDKIELWEGVLVEMSPKNVNHSTAMTLATDYFYENLRKRGVIRVQDPIRLDDYSEPEPDLVLVNLPVSKYALGHPTPADVLLILEIADSTVKRDREKAKNYARNGIVQYLILNLNTREIEDYREPDTDGYRQKRTYKQDEKFALVAFPEIEIAVAELLPPEKAN